MPHPGLAKEYPQAYISMGETAENVARKYQVTRDRAAGARRREPSGRRRRRRRRASSRTRSCRSRRGTAWSIRTAASVRRRRSEALAGLEARLRRGRHGHRRHLLAADRRRGRGAGLHRGLRQAQQACRSLARLKSIAVAGCAPEIMGIGPVPATQKALKRAGLAIKDIDIVELNEAFASQAIACMRELGIDETKANIDGGAHRARPSLGRHRRAHHRQGGRAPEARGQALRAATQCIGGGQGIATDPRAPLARATSMAIKKAAVIGAGVMGGGIAAHIANAGMPVVLLDIVPPRRDQPQRRRRAAIERLLKTDPAPFMHRDNARLVTPGNLEDHLGLLAECDWIVEAVLEKLEVKHATLRQARAGAQARLDRLLQHLDHPARATWSRACRRASSATSSSRISSIRRATCASSRSSPARRRAADAVETIERVLRRARSARAWSMPRTRRASSPTASAACGSSRRCRRLSISGSHGRGGGRGHGPALRHAARPASSASSISSASISCRKSAASMQRSLAQGRSLSPHLQATGRSSTR